MDAINIYIYIYMYIVILIVCTDVATLRTWQKGDFSVLVSADHAQESGASKEYLVGALVVLFRFTGSNGNETCMRDSYPLALPVGSDHWLLMTASCHLPRVSCQVRSE